MVGSITSHHMGFDYPITNPVDCIALQLCEGGLWHFPSEWCAGVPTEVVGLFPVFPSIGTLNLIFILGDTGDRYCEVGTKSGKNFQSDQQALLILLPITVSIATKAILTSSEQNPFIFPYRENENPNPYA